MSETVEKLLDAAESQIRLKGFHAVSFRDLADQLGIKSASVHYHFPQKETLGVALIERYSFRFFEILDKSGESSDAATDGLAAIIAAYRDALVGSDRICLCGMLGAEIAGLPEPVASAVTEFLGKNIEWLAERLPPELSTDTREARAAQAIATLQGAMMLARSMGKEKYFDDAAAGLNALCEV